MGGVPEVGTGAVVWTLGSVALGAVRHRTVTVTVDATAADELVDGRLIPAPLLITATGADAVRRQQTVVVALKR
jgi:hypothetical protein